ncbi:hypothetical protein [Pantoea sp. X85]|uniref:hypothetical protein n=1 Tax=Pantoea sp. X85 TaxID=3037258 RepID=UPI0024133DAB|nr:hypothetical protein [Pantoea sp. X85]WFL66410.1 hypothetical protein P6287_13645 [Pantoea sp. X85]
MSETTDLAVLEIKPEQAPALYVANGLDAYLDQIRELAAEVPDVTTKKGRDRIGSLARMVGSSKKAIEEPGRAYLKQLKEAVKPAEDELRRFTRECDTIRDQILAPRAAWDVDQERIKAGEDARIAAQKLAAQIESDHEIALLLNDKFDRDAAEAKAEAERQRIAHEEEIKRQAVEQARIEAEQKAQQEREAAARREADLKAAKEKAEADAKAAQERAEREAKEAQERTARLAQEAREQAEREKQAAIAEEQRKAKAAEDARLAEEKRIANEAVARAANEAHRKKIGTEIVTALLGHTSLTREQAIEVLVALKDSKIPHTRITY